MAMPNDFRKVVSEIDTYIRQNGGTYAQWYVGIAADARRRLFVDHCVREQIDRWVFRDCGSDGTARAVEDYFHRKGCDGGPGGGDYTTRYAYAYRKAPHTNP